MNLPLSDHTELLMNLKGLLFVPLATAVLWTLIGSAMYIAWMAYSFIASAGGTTAA
jgi:hypothetical protein